METGLVIGREKEKSILQEALTSSKSEFVVVYGRRRVGKTFLVKNVLGDQIDFEMTGIQDGNLNDQLQNFKEKRRQLDPYFGGTGKIGVHQILFPLRKKQKGDAVPPDR